MSFYTPMPLELVFDGWNREPGPFLDLTIRGVTMRVVPVAPGIGRIERLLNAPLDCYLQPEFSPGQTVCYAAEPAQANPDKEGPEVPTYLP
ncbi:hypothetical protein GE107_00340 [Cohnella sp. CFH 77786]|uniref:YlzJ-like family protein n=1 Tax=Cohnella sp. CFH 77786 TaxID=2662265 RepID=UPI001C6089D0|nr:YlzJ-like family protein [Cohnella sp. CFH 77786]MBW5444512.1 hypothetical protein [Cohnella sp. CFH 77786]